MLTGRPPFQGETVLDTLVQVLHEEPIPPNRLRPGLSRDVETICLKCLRKEPSKRFESAAGLADNLERYLSGRPILVRPVGPFERSWRWARRNSAVASLVAALVLAVAAGFTGITWKWLEAERLRRIATDEAGAKTRALGEVSTNLYFHSMALAHRELLANNVEEAERLLDSQSPERRGWEWHYLKRLCHSELRVFRHPSMMFDAISFTPDGRHLVTSNPTGHVEVRPADGESTSHVLEGICFWIGPTQNGSTTVLTKNGRDLISWDPTTGKEVGRRQLVHFDRSPVLGFSANGKRFATVSPRGAITVWDAGSGSEVCTLEGTIDLAQMRLGPVQWMSIADFSPDGQRLAVPTDKVVKVFDTTTGRELQTLGDGKSFIWRVAFRPDGRAVAAARQDGTGVVWDLANGREVCSLHGHTNFVRGIVFSPDGDRLATSSYDKTIRLWDARTGDELATYRGHAQGVQAVAFSPDGKRLTSTCQDRSIRIWDATTDTRAMVLRDNSAVVREVVVTSDNQQILGLCADGALVAWDVRTGKVLDRHILTRGAAFPARVAFSPDGRWCAVTINSDKVQIWDVVRGTPVCSPLEHGNEVFCLAFSPDGSVLATGGGKDRTVRIWDVATGHLRTDLGKHSREIRSLQFLSDGGRLGVVTWEGAVTVWNLNEIAIAGSYSETRHKVMAIAPAADGQSFILGGADGEVVAWNPADQSEVSLVRRSGDNLMAVRVSPDGRRVAVAVDSTTVKIWDPNTGHECIALRSNLHKILRVFFSSDGNRLITLDNGGTVKVYNATPE